MSQSFLVCSCPAPLNTALDDKRKRMLSTIASALHLAVVVLAIGAWALGMYHWSVTNSNLKRGVSKFVLLNPASYWNTELFTERGIESRRKTITAFVLMAVFAFAAFGLRLLKEAAEVI